MVRLGISFVHKGMSNLVWTLAKQALATTASSFQARRSLFLRGWGLVAISPMSLSGDPVP
jgi:hypothetical protein